MNSPMTISIILYDSNSNIVKIFESNKKIYDYSYFTSYTLASNIITEPGNYELVLRGYDCVNSDSHTLYLTVSISSDTNKPVITLLGDNPVTVYQGSTYNDAGATAYDAEDGDI